MSIARADSFIRIDLRGAGPLLDTLENVAGILGASSTLEPIMHRAARPIENQYRREALRHDATGNLARSTTHKVITYRSGVVVAVAGPRHTGNAGATGAMASGNHSWLVEFGSHGRRSPAARGKRKTYVNVHQLINRRMTVVARLEDSDDFHNRGRGYYFLMSSWKEPTRQARRGKGYPHDFLPDLGDGPRVYTLKPGQTYGAMPAFHLMENTINARRAEAQSIIRNGIIDAINAAVRSSL